MAIKFAQQQPTKEDPEYRYLKANPKNLKRYNCKYQSNEVVSGIYFLFKENKLVYIGKSENIFKRVSRHNHKNKFDSFSFYRLEVELIDIAERVFLNKHTPEYNKDYFTDYSRCYVNSARDCFSRRQLKYMKLWNLDSRYMYSNKDILDQWIKTAIQKSKNQTS